MIGNLGALIYENAPKWNHDRRQFRSQTSDLWTDAATAVRAVREEKETEERESEEKESVERR
jgi:hypothetical protein